jgi:hypothetical protein
LFAPSTLLKTTLHGIMGIIDPQHVEPVVHNEWEEAHLFENGKTNVMACLISNRQADVFCCARRWTEKKQSSISFLLSDKF